jgi:hypothetical protein
MSSIFAWVKRAIVRIWRRIVEAVETLTVPTVNEDGTVPSAPLGDLFGKAAAIVVVAAGLLFMLFPSESAAAMTIGDNLIRLATIMWNGAT